MIKESIFYRMLLFLANVFKKYEMSVFYNLMLKISSASGRLYTQSRFYEFFTTPSKIYKKYETSVFYSLKENTLNRLVSLIRIIVLSCGESVVFSKIRNSLAAKVFKFENILTAFFVFILVIPHKYWNNLYAVIGAAVLLAVYFINIAESGEKVKFTQSVWLVVFLISIVMAMFVTPDFKDGIRIALFVFSAVIFFVLIKDGIKTKESLNRIIYGIITAFIVACVYGIYQGITKISADSMFTDIANNKGMPGRITSMFENPNNFAEIIVLLLPFTVSMAISSKNKTAKILCSAAFFIGIAALLMTYTRGCYISFVISMLVFIFMYDYRLILPVAVILMFFMPFLPESVINRIMTIGSRQDTSSAYRIYLWEGVMKLIRKEGITGVGLGSEAFLAAYTPFASRFAATAPHSHMLYLELFIEMGVLGGVSFFAFMISSLRKGFAVFNKTDKETRCVIIAAISAFMGIAFSAATEYIWFYPRVMFVFWIVLGILLCSVKLQKK